MYVPGSWVNGMGNHHPFFPGFLGAEVEPFEPVSEWDVARNPSFAEPLVRSATARRKPSSRGGPGGGRSRFAPCRS